MGESILGAGEGKNRAARQRSTPHTRTERVSSPLVFFVTLRSPPAAAMSDEEYYEEEEVTSNTSKKGDGNFLKARQEAKKGELDEQLREYINEWRKQRAKEEEELKRLKEKRKRKAMMQAQKEKQQAAGQGAKGPKKTDSGMGNVQDARREMTKTKEQLEEEKKISLSIRIKPLDLDAMDGDQLTNKASELWDTIVRLETEKY